MRQSHSGMGCVFIRVLLQTGQARITSGHISSRGMMAENATGILASTPQSLAGLGFPRRQIPCSGIRIPCSGSNSALKFPARLRREFCKKTTQYQCLCGDARGDPNFKHVKTQTRQNKEWLSNRGIGRGYSRFCQARKYLDSAIAIAALHWRSDQRRGRSGSDQHRATSLDRRPPIISGMRHQWNCRDMVRVKYTPLI